MAGPPRSVDQAIARFDEYSARLDGHMPAASTIARRRLSRNAASLGRRLAGAALTIGAIVAATFAYALIVAPIGIGGFLFLILAALCVLIFFSVGGWNGPKEKPFTDTMPNREVVRTLESFLGRRSRALPAPAARRVEAIAEQLPLLENRLAETDLLDPLAQDARRLMGKHLPELIERYERVPEAYRQQRDGEGLTVDERLVASLDAARTALGEIGAKLTKSDLDAFETQGRFIESRYRGEEELKA